MSSEIAVIRDATMDDLPVIVELAAELGYPSEPEAMEKRLRHAIGDRGQAIFVAERAGRVIGMAHVSRQFALVVDVRADLGALVVDRSCRGLGIGRFLLEAAADWARKNGCGRLYVRSNIVREEAHGFYERLGYECVKLSKIFIKNL